MPLGIYRVIDKPIQQGDIVVFCLNGRAAEFTKLRNYVPTRWLPTGCDLNLTSLMKSVAALAGDHIKQTEFGIEVNHALIPNTKHMMKDSTGKDMLKPDFPEIVPKNYLLLLSHHHPLSWDSRYYGLIPSQNVQKVVRPLLTFTYHRE